MLHALSRVAPDAAKAASGGHAAQDEGMKKTTLTMARWPPRLAQPAEPAADGASGQVLARVYSPTARSTKIDINPLAEQTTANDNVVPTL
jgi:hypothetical protein